MDAGFAKALIEADQLFAKIKSDLTWIKWLLAANVVLTIGLLLS